MCGRSRTTGPIGKIAAVLLLAATALLGIAASAGATPLDYTFSGNNQGWQQSQDNGDTVTTAGFQPSGGNPGGRLTARDSGPDDGCPDTTPCELLTFFSPTVPTLGANYGGTGSFDLRASVNPDFAAELLLLPTGTEYLDGLITESAGTEYHHLSIPLNETANWKICPYAGGLCRRPTQLEYKALIATSDMVGVIADVGPNGTGETYDLDNVTLTDGPPPPPSPPLPPPPHKKPKKCKKKHGKKRAASAKKKKCKKKRRAATPGLRG